MWSRLVKADPERGLQVWLDIDEDDGSFTFRHVDTTWREVVAHNHVERDVQGRTTHGRDWVKVGEIPWFMWMWLREQGIADDPVALKKFLNDADHRAFRSFDGVV